MFVGVVPPRITERHVILRSMEANEMEGVETVESAGGGGSMRKKRRSGSIQGIFLGIFYLRPLV